MENKAKRFLRLLLAIVMVVAILPMTFVLATETDNVAKIGETGYATLEEAFAAAKNGETVELIPDTYGDIVIPAEFGGTLAIGTCKLNSITNNSATAKIVINGNVVVENANGSAITGEVINISGNGTLTAIANGDHAYGIGGDNTKSITIENVHIVKVQGGRYGEIGTDTKYYKDAPEGGAGIGSGSNGAVITLTNVTIDKALGGSKAAGIGALYHTGATINITGCEITYVEGGATAAGIGGSRVSNGATASEAVTINILNSNITAVGGVYAAGIGSGYDTHCQENQPICTINIDGSTINATGGKYATGIGTGYHNAGLAGEIKNSTVTAVSGEKFYKDEYTSAQDIGFGVVNLEKEGSNNNSFIIYNGTKIMLPGNAVAQIGAQGYATVEEAFAAAKNGETVELIADSYEDIVIPADFSGTLAIGTCTINSITNNSETAKIVINGNVVVENANGSAITGEVINISGNGTLTAIANGDHAYGIGGDNTKSITIENVHIVKVQGGRYGEIGTDTKYYKDAPEGGAGIGSGSNGAVITLTNVTIDKALGGSKAAGIGALYHTGATINITGCEITYVEGGATAAGIGGSRVSNGATASEAVTINILNSNITAVGGVYAAGIGSGYDTHCQENQPICTINIDGSTINATGGKYAAGVGTGYHNAGMAGEIKNSTITAASGEKVYKDTYTSAQDIGFGVVDMTREGSDNDSYIIYNGTKITLPRNVAQIGETGYATLAEALKAAQAGQTITFLADITEDVTVNKSVTIDGAGKTFTGNMALTNRADIKIVNVNFDGKGYNGYAVDAAGAYYVTVESCTAKNCFGFLQVASGTVNVTVKNVTISDVMYGVKIDYSNEVVLENVDISASVAAVLNSNYGEKTITIKNSKLNIYGTWTRSDITKSNIVFEGANTIDRFITEPSLDVFKLAAGATLTAPNDVTVITDVSDKRVVHENGVYKLAEKTIQVTVTVGDATMVAGNAMPQFTYTTNVDVPGLSITPTTTADGKTAGTYAITVTAPQMEDYTFTVVSGTLTVEKALVRVYAKNNANVKYFASLKEAIEFAVAQKANVPVYLLSNITIDETIVVNDTNAGLVELQGDKTGGQTFTLISTHSGEMFRVEKGTLAVKNLKINSQGDTFYVTGGTLNLNYHSKGKQFLEITSQTGNCIYIRGGSVNVNVAKLTALGEYPAIQGNGNYAGNVTITKWNIGDGTYPVISAPNSDMAIYWPGNGVLTIEGGQISGYTALYAKSGTIVINGGEFIGTGAKVDCAHNSNGAFATGDAVIIESCMDAAYETPVVSITGGTFTSANGEALMFYACDANADAKAIMELTGGTYSSRPSSTWCAEGYLPVFADAKNVTTWSVKEATAVAAIGEEMYANVQHAINDAATGDEIDLVADVLDQPVYVNTDLTLDLNGHTYIQNRSKQTIVYAKDGSQKYLNPNRATSDFKGMINVMGGSLTVKDSVGTGMIESTVGNIFCIAKPLTIENGVFKVGTVAYDGSKARIVVTKNSYTYGVKLDINGGEFYTAEGGMPFYVGFAAGNKSDNVSIEKAWFSESIQTWIDAKNAKGFTYNQSEAKSSENVDGYLVTKGVINVDGVWFGSWDDAESSIKKNSTIVLYADVANTYGGTVAKDYKFPANGGNITLNLNGHTFKSAMSEASKMTTVTVQYGTVLNIIGGGNIVIENNSYPFVINPKSTVKIEEGITFTGTMQWNVNNGNSGDLYIGETAMVGVNGIFKPTAATRIIMNEQGDWTLSMGSLIMTADDATLVNNTLTINKNCKLDLNGNDLTAKKVEGYGNLIDSMDGVGTVTGELWFDGHSNGGYLPLKNGDCYSLFRTNAKIRGAKKVDADTLKIGCTIYFENAKAYELLANMVENNNSSITVTWSGSDVGEFAYNFSKNMLTAFANKAKEQLATNGKVTTSMNLDVDGMSELVTGDIVSSVPSISSNTGVVISGERFSYTIS